MFRGRTLLIVTQHAKEEVLAPVLEEALGVRCVVSEGFDTDRLGTFSGEVHREEDSLSTARKKCLHGMEKMGLDLAVASEGSFGPHPTIPFIPADDEWLVLIDQKHDIEIVVREISTNTNFQGTEVSSEDDLLAFAGRAGFPSHGLILKDAANPFTRVVKGITRSDVLIDTFHRLTSDFGKAYIETDMRAMFNPTRMAVIKSAALKLAEKTRSECPVCQRPGFGVTEAREGLPCALCHAPTRSTLSHIYTCLKCGHREEKMYPAGKTLESAMYCDLCNP
jgi:hypothetical protein